MNEELASRARTYRKNNPDKIHGIERRYRLRRNEDPIRGPNRKRYVRKKWDNLYKTNASFHLAHNIRCRIRKAVKQFSVGKAASSVDLLGCSIPEVRAKLEAAFKPGMTWENFGSVWHIDHKRPCASFDLTKPDEQRECFNHSNLQPLFVVENLKKGKLVSWD
jgi:hypothetical protein